jgi:hypothetical protein
VLLDILGTEFQGILGCDYFSAYRRYQRVCGVCLQFCLAHLIRDVKFLTTLSGPDTGVEPCTGRAAAVEHSHEDFPIFFHLFPFFS